MRKENIEEVSAAYMCSNCGACSAICPTDAVDFRFSGIGRLYAVVERDKCTGCGLCRKVCPSLDEQDLHEVYADPYIGNIREVFVGRCSDDRLFFNAQSGGACSATISYLFRTKQIDAAAVCKMKPGNPPVVCAKLLTGIEDIEDTQKSCYTPVEILSILKVMRQYKSIAVVGLPCHIQGLESLMRMGRCKNVKYRLGLICDRTLCNTIQDVFIRESGLFPNYKIVWRHKLLNINNLCLPYKTAPVSITSEDKSIKVYPNTYRFWLKDLFTSPRCRVCCDKLNVFADVVYGDPWRMKGIDEQNGSSLVVTRTEAGSALVYEMMTNGEIQLSAHSTDELVRGQLIDKRRKQVATYSRAIHLIPNTIKSYLYNQGENLTILVQAQKKARREIRQFLLLDAAPKSVIIRKACKIIARKRLMQQFHIPGIERRVKKVIRKIV